MWLGGVKFALRSWRAMKAKSQFEGPEHDSRLVHKIVAGREFQAIDAVHQAIPRDRLFEARNGRAGAGSRPLREREMARDSLAVDPH
jgi:hypothetical protein